MESPPSGTILHDACEAGTETKGLLFEIFLPPPITPLGLAPTFGGAEDTDQRVFQQDDKAARAGPRMVRPPADHPCVNGLFGVCLVPKFPRPLTFSDVAQPV